LVYEDPEFNLHNKITLEDATTMFMTENQRFHDLCMAFCRYHKDERNMVLVDRIELGENLLRRATELGISAEFIYGKTSKKERKRIIELFSVGKLDVLIGGKIVNRGLDVKGGIDNLICATGGKLRSDFLQKIGRALRVNKRGYSNVYDFFFRCNHYLYTHSQARLETIVDAGYEAKVLFGYTDIDGEELIRRQWRKPARPKGGRGGKQEKTLFHK
jgi:ERCC4-related helicase